MKIIDRLISLKKIVKIIISNLKNIILLIAIILIKFIETNFLLLLNKYEKYENEIFFFN
jgi:hypothetical protein